MNPRPTRSSCDKFSICPFVEFFIFHFDSSISSTDINLIIPFRTYYSSNFHQGSIYIYYKNFLPLEKVTNI